MNWGGISGVFFFATFKFMFAPLTGRALKLTFWETYFSSVAGGTFSAILFFFTSEMVIRLINRRRKEKIEMAEKLGQPIKVKKKFTKSNRFIIKLKRSFGIVGVCFWAPFFLSVPIGSMITAKFYGKQAKAFPLIVLGMFVNAMVTSVLVYWIV